MSPWPVTLRGRMSDFRGAMSVDAARMADDFAIFFASRSELAENEGGGAARSVSSCPCVETSSSHSRPLTIDHWRSTASGDKKCDSPVRWTRSLLERNAGGERTGTLRLDCAAFDKERSGSSEKSEAPHERAASPVQHCAGATWGSSGRCVCEAVRKRGASGQKRSEKGDPRVTGLEKVGKG
ncbi:hypothetical protein BSKO_09152 [Bryopsis sp. KO-2023]|nr:hypothetical protein BSKO_09152 [Bryopsis sp. KO-2023]